MNLSILEIIQIYSKTLHVNPKLRIVVHSIKSETPSHPVCEIGLEIQRPLSFYKLNDNVSEDLKELNFLID